MSMGLTLFWLRMILAVNGSLSAEPQQMEAEPCQAACKRGVAWFCLGKVKRVNLDLVQRSACSLVEITWRDDCSWIDGGSTASNAVLEVFSPAVYLDSKHSRDSDDVGGTELCLGSSGANATLWLKHRRKSTITVPDQLKTEVDVAVSPCM